MTAPARGPAGDGVAAGTTPRETARPRTAAGDAGEGRRPCRAPHLGNPSGGTPRGRSSEGRSCPTPRRPVGGGGAAGARAIPDGLQTTHIPRSDVRRRANARRDRRISPTVTMRSRASRNRSPDAPAAKRSSCETDVLRTRDAALLRSHRAWVPLGTPRSAYSRVAAQAGTGPGRAAPPPPCGNSPMYPCVCDGRTGRRRGRADRRRAPRPASPCLARCVTWIRVPRKDPLVARPRRARMCAIDAE